MIYYYKFKLCKEHKKKLFFYSKNSLNSRIEITKKENSYKNFQQITFNQKHQFTIKKRFTLDWHIKPNKSLGKLTKNNKFLRLASFYSQLNSNAFTKKFTSLMIYQLEIQTQQNRKQNTISSHPYDNFTVGSVYFPSKIKKFSNSTEIELEKNQKIFASLQYKNNIWFSKMFIPFSNRSFWWVLVPTQSILTHIHWNIFFKRITNLLEMIKLSTSATKNGTPWNSTVLFDFFPEFLIEKSINWYWMLPFFGCFGLMRSNMTYINPSFFQNYYPTYNLENQFDLNIDPTLSQNRLQNNITSEIFEFVDYKKFLFDSSFKYINHLFLNSNNFFLQIKKTWLSRQKEHYICNYEDDLIQKDLKKNVDKLTKLAIIYWWKKNWEEITYPKFCGECRFIENFIDGTPPINFKKNQYWSYINNLQSCFNRNKNTKFYSFDSLFYSKFYWYWHNISIKNIIDEGNISQWNFKIISKNKLIENQKYRENDVLSNTKPTLYSSPFYDNLVNKFLLPVPINTELLGSSSNHCFPMNEFPLKIQFPWLISNVRNSLIKQKINTKDNYDSITEIIDNNFENIHMHYQTNNNNQYKKNFIQQQKLNLIFKNILYSNFIKNQNYQFLKEFLFPLCLKNNVSRSSFIFCVSAKNRSSIKSNQLLKNNLQLIKPETPLFSSVILNYKTKKRYNNLLLKKQHKFVEVCQLNLYNSIGCEIFESDFNYNYKWSNLPKIKINEINNWCFADIKNFQMNEKALRIRNNLPFVVSSHALGKEKYFELIEVQKNSKTLNNYNNWIKQNTKKNLSISSFHRASFLLDNLLSNFSFELGMTWLTRENFINYYYKIINLTQFYNKNSKSPHEGNLLTFYLRSNDAKMIKMRKNPIIMSGYYLSHFNLILKKRNDATMWNRELSNRIQMNYGTKWYLALPPNIYDNKINCLFYYNKPQYEKSKYNFDKVLHFNIGGSYLSITKKQQLCILKKKSRLIYLKSKELENFFIYNLLKNSQNLLSQFRKLEKNKKKIEYNDKFFNIKMNSKYKIVRPTPLLKFKNNIRQIKKNKIRINILNKKQHNTLILLNFSDYMIKKGISFRNNIFFPKPELNLFFSILFTKDPLSIIKMKKKNFFNSLNTKPYFLYVSNKSIFWNYINFNYSFRFLDATRPFIVDKFDAFIKNTRFNLVNQTTENKKNGYVFSNFLLKKYQRKNKNWPIGTNPQGFFYKRINKLNFKSIKKKQYVEHSDANNEIKHILNIQLNQLKKVSELKPIGELLWEVRTKHKIPEVLLLQQTLFFQKKLVRKSTEENNFFNQEAPSSENQSLSQKAQIFVRKMTQRRYFRKHVFLETLFEWTRDAISLRKMLRKINFKNDWQIFLKFILKSKKMICVASTHPDSYSNWYKKNLYNNKNLVKKNLLSYSLNINIPFNKSLRMNFKTDKIRPFFYKFIQTENKCFLSKKSINTVLKDFYKNLLIDYTLFNTSNKGDWQPSQILNFKNFFNEVVKRRQMLNFRSLRDIKNVYYFNNLLILPESQIFSYFSLPKFFIKTQPRNLTKKMYSINKSYHRAPSSLIFKNHASLFSFNPFMKKNQLSKNVMSDNANYINFYNNVSNGINSHYFINQQNLLKKGFPLYHKKRGYIGIEFNINKKYWNLFSFQGLSHLASRVGFSLNKYVLLDKKNCNKIKQKFKQLNTSFLFFLYNIFNGSRYYKIFLLDHTHKFFQINNEYDNISSYSQRNSFKQMLQKSQFHFYSNEESLSIRRRLFFQQLYFTHIFWHSNDFFLNTTSTIFNQNELIKNVLIHNWVFKIRCIDSEQNYQKHLNLNFNKVLATLSTWQSKYQIRRDFILQIFYIYLDHIGAFLNYIINNLIFENIVNQIENFIFINQIRFVKIKEPIKPLCFALSLNLKKEFIIQPTWSFYLLNHMKTQYPHLYNKIKINNQYNFENIQLNKSLHFLSYLLIKTPEFDSKKQIMFSPNFKTQLLLIDSLKKKYGKKAGYLKTYNIFSNVYNNSISIPFTHQSIIQKLSSQSMIIRNSTIFCQKWIQNKQFLNLYKIKLLKKQQKLQQILNVFNEKKQNSNERSLKRGAKGSEAPSKRRINSLSANTLPFHLNFKTKHSLYKKTTTMSFKRRAGFLFNRSLITTNFNTFSSLPQVMRGSISFYINNNIEKSVHNFIFFSQILLLHVCLIFCFIFVYQSAFHFCLKNFVSIFAILIHYFLNIRYRLKRLIKYVYQSTVQSFITNTHEYIYSYASIHNKLFLFFNYLSNVVFSNKFFIWGKMYKSSIPSLIDFLFKNPLNLVLGKTIFSKFKNRTESSNILLEKTHINNTALLHYVQSFFHNIKQKDIINEGALGSALNLKIDLIPSLQTNLLKIINKKKVNNRMSLLRNVNIIKKDVFDKKQKYQIPRRSIISQAPQTGSIKNVSTSTYIVWKKDFFSKSLKTLIKKEKITERKNNNFPTFQLNLKLLKWNLGLILLIGESEIFAELEPYREMHWYFLKRLPILLRSNTYSEDPINMYDYQADEKLRKFKEQFKKSTAIFQKRQNTIEKKTQRNRNKEYLDDGNKANHGKFMNNNEKLNYELINKKYPNKNSTFLKTRNNTETIILVIKSDKQLKNQLITVAESPYIKKMTYLLNNFYFIRKKVSRGQPFWKPLFSFLAHTLFISRLSKLNRRFRNSVLIMNTSWIPFGPLLAIFCTFLWKNYIVNFTNLLNNKNYLLEPGAPQFQSSKKKYKMVEPYLNCIPLLQNAAFRQKNHIINLNKLNFSAILRSQKQLNQKNDFRFGFVSLDYCSPFQMALFPYNRISNFEYKQFTQEIKKVWGNINHQNYLFSELSPPLLKRVFLWNFVKFEKKYKRAIFKWINKENNKKNKVKIDFIRFFFREPSQFNDAGDSLHYSNFYDKSTYIINKYKSIYINNQEQSAQNRYIHYNIYDPKVRLYRFYTNFSKNFNDIGMIQDAKNVHPIFGSLLCEISSGLFSIEANRKKYNNLQKQVSESQYNFVPSLSIKNILLIGNTNSSNFVLLVQAFAAETGLKLFMEDAKRLRRLGRRGINKSTKRLEKLFEIAQYHSPSIIFLEDIDVIGSKRRVIKINEEEDDDDMAIRSFFSKLIYRKQHHYKSLSQSFINQNLFINNQEIYRNMQKSILPESPIPSNLIKYQLTRRKAFSNYFSNTSNLSYKSFITKFNILKKVSSIDGNCSKNISSSPTNAIIIWKLLKSKLVTPKKTIKEAPWKHIPVDSMRSIPLITYSIRVKVAKLTMLAIYTMTTQLRLVKDLIKLLEKIQYENYKGFIVFATTNKLSTLDPSLRRPGRFDETVYLPSLTVNPDFKHAGRIHFLNVLSIDSDNFVNFSRTFNIINASNFTINWNVNSVYGDVFLQDNYDKLFYLNRISVRDLINSTADKVYNQNIFMQNQNNVYLNFVTFDILGNIGFQKPNFSIYSKSVVLLSLAYSKAGQLIIKLFFKKQYNGGNSILFNSSKKIINKLAFNSENNELTLWPNAHIFSQFKKLNISYISQQQNIKNCLINYFAGKIGEFCFFSFYKKELPDSQKKTKLNHFFDTNLFGLRSLYGIQPNRKNINSVIFFLIRTSCLYSKNHLTSKLLYLDDLFKKRQRIFSDNLGPSLLYEYFNLNTEYFLKKNNISLEEQLQKQQMQKYLLNLQKKPLRKFMLNPAAINRVKNRSYFNKIYNQNILLTEINKNPADEDRIDLRLAIYRVLFNELGSLDLIALRPTAMNYYYDKKIVSKQRFRKYTYKWWNWHLKRTIDSLEEFQYLDFFPYADKQYNPRRQRWILTNGYSAYWLAQEKILYYQIYEQLIIECFQRSYLHLDRHREMLDYLVQFLISKQLLTEIEWILFFKRFI